MAGESKLKAKDCLLEKENKDLRTIISEFYADPRTLGTTQAALGVLLRGCHKNEHVFSKGQLDNLWKTGSGAAKIPKRMYKNILFRDLLQFNPITKDFPLPEPKSNQATKNRKQNSTPDYDEIRGSVDAEPIIWNSTIAESDIESDSDESYGSCNSGDEADDDDDNDSDYKGDGGRIKVSEIDVHGIEPQLKNDAANNRTRQEMAYFGIEKVLLGENPGILDYDGYTNALRTIALVDSNAFSDRIVTDLFKGLPIAMVSARTNHKYFSTSIIVDTIIFVFTFIQPPLGNRKSEPLFEIDLFVDGVAMFNNSMVPSCIPILGKCIICIRRHNSSKFIFYYFSTGRVVKIDSYVLPPRRSKPFIIAFYHGDGHPDLDAYLSDLIAELEHLHPCFPADETNPRSITVKVRCIIADAPARQWLKGIKPHTGYFSCERCKIKGEMFQLQRADDEVPESGAEPGVQTSVSKPVTQRGMKFASLIDAPRRDEEWEDYLDIEPSEMEKEGKIDDRMKHRQRITPIDKLAMFGIKPISSFPLEEMHLTDGGAFKDSVKILLKIPKEWKAIAKRKRPTYICNRIKKKPTSAPKTLAQHDARYITTKDLVAINCRISVWSRLCTPLEFQRRCRTLVCFKYWKMAETRQFVMYYLIPLYLSLGKLTMDKREFAIIANLIYGYSLITGNSYRPVSKTDRIKSRQLLREYFVLFSKLSKRILTYKVHCFWKHLVDDARKFKCRTTALSAYPFENLVRFFRQVS
jgi:hypothetical protein